MRPYRVLLYSDCYLNKLHNKVNYFTVNKLSIKKPWWNQGFLTYLFVPISRILYPYGRWSSIWDDCYQSPPATQTSATHWNTVLHEGKDFAVSPIYYYMIIPYRDSYPFGFDVTARTSIFAYDGRYPLPCSTYKIWPCPDFPPLQLQEQSSSTNRLI